jgi:hypothetical protein
MDPTIAPDTNRMKIATAEITTKSSREHDRYRMEIDDDHMRHIMDMMSDMYENPVKAVIREYSTNALDSHRAAGNTDPVRITLPTALKPNLKIQDWGLGLDLDGLINVYRKYGASTKRDSNDQVGGFGIGAKSAFTVADQYTVIGVKNGVRTSVLFTRNDDGDADMRVLGQKNVDEPNGVTVNIPIADNHPAYVREAAEIFSHWDPSTYDCPGVEIPYIYQNCIHVSDTVTLLESNYANRTHHNRSLHSRGQSGIILRNGETPYPLSPSLLKNLEYDSSWHIVCRQNPVVINLPIGSVDLAPSREGLRESKRTIKAVQAALDQGLEDVKLYLLKQLDEADTEAEAILCYIKKFNIMQIIGDKPTYRGKEFPVYPDPSIPVDERARSALHNPEVYWCGIYSRPHAVKFILVEADIDDLEQPPLEHKELSAEEYTLTKGEFIRACSSWHGRDVICRLDPEHDEVNSHGDGYYLAFAHQAENDPVIQALTCARVDYLSLQNSLRKATSRTATGRVKNIDLPYRVMIGEGHEVMRNVTEMVAKGGKIFYQHGNNRPTTSVYSRLPKGSQLVLIPGHRQAESFLERLEKVGGNARPVEDAVKNIVLREVAALDEQSLLYLRGRVLPNAVRDTLDKLLVRDYVGTPEYEKSLRKAFPACPRGKSKQLRSLALLAKQYDIKLIRASDENLFKDFFKEYPALELAYLALANCDSKTHGKWKIFSAAQAAIRAQGAAIATEK